MKVTLNIDDKLLRRAAELTGVTSNADLVHLCLEALVSSKAAERLGQLGGTDPKLGNVYRRRMGKRS